MLKEEKKRWRLPFLDAGEKKEGTGKNQERELMRVKFDEECSSPSIRSATGDKISKKSSRHSKRKKGELN